MADTNVEPGAPSAKATTSSLSPANTSPSERPSTAAGDVSKPSSSNPPKSSPSALAQIDRLLLRLNKLLASPGGLSSFLSTFNYTLYLIIHLQSKSHALTSLTRRLISHLTSRPYTPIPAVVSATPTGAAALAALISRARTTLRLFGTLPLYAWLRTLLSNGPKPGADKVLHGIAITQCLSYLTYQALENVCFLADNGVVPKRVIAALNRGNPATEKVYLVGYRAWLAGISCEFLRLGREAQVERRKRAERVAGEGGKGVAEYEAADKRFDSKWWMDAMIASAWFPMALHLSNLTGGVPGWSYGFMGACGLVAGGQRAQGLWQATLHP
ncbi:hypothetical protein BU24DRAFT_497811 [Aaosphaeria arxii CBS 175.79]|uniref:Peroxin 11C n=1 Tax=Aaosphaeria arxii CBS 175.79 TaxID=1450172 RepID=A0A6A5X6Z7_9PLEO|nr:uncharacterized protein BU24DRAFT_497811 [Aaosphaeria arxii CBS 175.79]KAF2008617.1 hypothetical protein BU24DRAFT_497811 [Aaosphaeria arxii CBS 175.79]